MEIENSVLSTRLSGNYQIPIGERRLRTVVLKSSDFDLVENKNLDQFTIFSIKKSNVRTMFFTLFSCVWFLLHQIYPAPNVFLSRQSYINHKRTDVFCSKRFQCRLQQQKFKSDFLELVNMDTEEPSWVKLNKEQSDNICLSQWHL